MIGHFGSQSQAGSTWESMIRLQDLILNRYMADMHDTSGDGELPQPGYAGVQQGRQLESGQPPHPQLRYLFINPGPSWNDSTTVDSSAETPFPSPNVTLLSPQHWNGPYVTNQGARYKVMDPTAQQAGTATSDQYGVADVVGSTGTVTTPGDPASLDAWNNPIVIQEPTTWDSSMAVGADPRKYARLVSAGPNGVLDTPETIGMPTAAQRGDDVVMFLFVPDQYGATSGPKLH
jgi:hypothetical protein